MMDNISSYLNYFIQIYRSSKSLKYGGYFITMLPFYAILIYNGYINSPLALLYILPLVPAFAAGFLYNTICDADKDPKDKNPITKGAVSNKFVLTSTVLLFLLSILFVQLIYTSTTSKLLFVLLIFLWLSYSGLKLRFKESILGPVIASFGFFVLPSIILLANFNYFNLGSIMLIIGLFIIYFAHEIKHTILDYDLDLSYNCRTFAVILGKKNANMIEYATLIIGFLFLLTSIYYLLPNSYLLVAYFFPNIYLILLFAIFLLLSIILTVLYGVRSNFDQKVDVIYNTLPYIATRTCYITIGLFLLDLPIIVILFGVWILFTDKYL
jgi:4-hydroxybenzoate polyprenyltransferase